MEWSIKILSLIILVIVLSVFFSPKQWLLSILAVHTPLTNSDAIVLPGGTRKERLPAVSTLYRDGYAPIVILAHDGVFSSWSKKDHRNLYNIEWAEEELVKLGVPREKILKLPFYGSSTMFDALAVKRYLLKSGLKKIILVTSDYHTRRTYWTFRHALKAYTTDITVYPAKSFGVDRKSIAVECVKLVYYVFRYGLLGLVPDANEVTLKES